MPIHDLYALVNPAVDECSTDWSTFDDAVTEAIMRRRAEPLAKAIHSHPMATRLNRSENRDLELAFAGMDGFELRERLLRMACVVLNQEV